MRKGHDGEKKTGGKNGGKKEEKRLMIIVATTLLPAVDRPNADRWKAAPSCQKVRAFQRKYFKSSKENPYNPKHKSLKCFWINYDKSNNFGCFLLWNWPFYVKVLHNYVTEHSVPRFSQIRKTIYMKTKRRSYNHSFYYKGFRTPLAQFSICTIFLFYMLLRVSKRMNHLIENTYTTKNV